MAVKDKLVNLEDLKVLGDYTGALKSALDDFAETQIGANIFDELWPQSGYLDTDGSELPSDTYKRTGFIPIDGTKSALYFLRSAQPYVLNLVFYDSSKAKNFNFLISPGYFNFVCATFKCTVGNCL